ncbi:MAG TPA: DUF397 domain-containing protein [Pseudonocardiaceae bacterium]|nr:DUF397 domain-containing protein [Pseudonocardiaceae bacterium]
MINDATFRKSSYSQGDSSCVEIGHDEDTFGVRDSKNMAGPVLAVSQADGRALVSAVKNGRFSR